MLWKTEEFKQLAVRAGLVAGLLVASACSDPVAQTTSCETFVACVKARDVRDKVSAPTDAARFEANGDCWGSPAGSLLCDRACTSGLAFLREKEPSLPKECTP